MPSNQRIILLAAAAAVLVVGFVRANGGGSSKPQGPVVRHFTVVVAAGKPVGGINKLAASRGDTVDLKVKSNVADEIHIHGYDFHRKVAAGGVVHFSFPASIDGTFVVELESRSEQVASLTVKI